ncbi:MAG: hypothetical protein ACI4DO_06045 [Roseburia sp.]
MNKGMIRGIILAAVFVAAVSVFGLLMNKTNQDMTTEMGEATLPTLSLFYQEEEINQLYAYTQEMNAVYMRDSITPVDTDRILPIRIHAGQYTVDGISYEIRSMDTTRLIASSKVEEYTQQDGIISADLTIQNLLEQNEEYLLIISLTHEGQQIYYYTRIIEPVGCNVREAVDFALNFHEKTFQEEGYKTLATYIEPDSSADNTTLAEVTIHSSLKQIAWGNLDGQPLGDPKVSIKEINSFYNVVVLDYVLTATGEDGGMEYYNVEEYFRLRYSEERMYLLDYKRTMNEIFRADSAYFEENTIDLGIGNVELEYMSNENGNYVCYVVEGDLWSFCADDEKLTQVFSFRNFEGMEDRENHMEHDIKVIKVDETGSADFVVYGYMNRGGHEGQVGICVYHYDSVVNTVEEELFIPSSHSYEVLKSELGQLMYENEAGEFFLMMDGILYQIDLASLEITQLVTGLDSENYAVSGNNQYIAYVEDGDEDLSSPIVVLNLESKESFDISGGEGKCVRPLGFIDNDFIYGGTEVSRVYTDQAGNIRYPMSDIYIVDTESSDHEILKDYHKDGYYTESIEVKDYTIYLKRWSYNGFYYVEAEGDTIMNREGELLTAVSVDSRVSERKQTETRLVLNEYTSIHSKRLLTPSQVLLETNTTISLTEPEPEEFYYAYAAGRLVAASDDAAQVIRTADENTGIVVGSRQQYIWKRAKKTSQGTIEVSVGEADVGSNSVAKALNAMMGVEQVDVSVGKLLAEGETPARILSENLPDARVINLSGCDVETVLYYVNLSTPVFAMDSGNHAVLIVGYDSSSIRVFDPDTGEVSKMSLADARETFNKAGNVYLAYLKE